MEVVTKQKHKNKTEGTRRQEELKVTPRKAVHPEISVSYMCKDTIIHWENMLGRYQGYKSIDFVGPPPGRNIPHNHVKTGKTVSPLKVTIRLSRTPKFDTNTNKEKQHASVSRSTKERARRIVRTNQGGVRTPRAQMEVCPPKFDTYTDHTTIPK